MTFWMLVSIIPFSPPLSLSDSTYMLKYVYDGNGYSKFYLIYSFLLNQCFSIVIYNLGKDRSRITPHDKNGTFTFIKHMQL